MDKDWIVAIILLVLGLPGPIWSAFRIWRWDFGNDSDGEVEDHEAIDIALEKERKENIGMIVYGVLALIGIVICLVILL